jgi:hypothetical protein
MPHTISDPDTAGACELIEAIVAQANLAAHLVNHYLTSLGLKASPARPTVLPKWFLLDLGTALQIAWWKQAGVLAHLSEAFPAPRDLVADLFRAIGDPDELFSRQPDAALATRVMAAHLRHFAFARRPLQAAVVVGFPDPNVMVDALAQFLWRTRRGAELPAIPSGE